MIVKRESSALAVPAASTKGARGFLASPAGEVTCELEPLALDAAGAHYELRVSNGTDGLLGASAFAVRVDDGRPVAALALEVAPRAELRTGFTLDPRLAYERVVAEVRGDGIHLVVEAAPPRGGRPRRRWAAPVAAFGGAALLAGATLVLFAAERPAVVSAALAASPGGELVARWATRGEGTRTYEVRDRTGAVVASGVLPSAAGTLTLGRGDAATLHVAIANRFGSDARDAAYARATPPPAIRIVSTPPPRIASIAFDPPRPGAPLTVRYESVRAGSVRLAIVDRTGATWFATAVAPGRGVARIPAPPAGSREPYALVASASQGTEHSDTRVPVPVVSTPGPTPTASSVPEADSGTTLADPNDTGGVLLVAPDVASPGQVVAVQLPYADGGRVAIVRDSDGAELKAVNVPRGRRQVSLVVPQGSGSSSVRATFVRGIGTVTMLHHLTILPRR